MFFLDCLSNESGSAIFLQPTDKANIISTLNSNKTSGPSSTL